MTRCPDCAQLETRVAELERKLEDLNTLARVGTCERCRERRLLSRCAACARDLCRVCATVKTCANTSDKEHRA